MHLWVLAYHNAFEKDLLLSVFSNSRITNVMNVSFCFIYSTSWLQQSIGRHYRILQAEGYLFRFRLWPAFVPGLKTSIVDKTAFLFRMLSNVMDQFIIFKLYDCVQSFLTVACWMWCKIWSCWIGISVKFSKLLSLFRYLSGLQVGTNYLSRVPLLLEAECCYAIV